MPGKTISPRDQRIAHKKVIARGERKAKITQKRETFLRNSESTKKNLIIISVIIFLLASSAIYRMVGTGSYLKQRSEQMKAMSEVYPQQFTYNGQNIELGPDGKLVLGQEELRRLNEGAGVDGQENDPEPESLEFGTGADEPEIIDLEI
eukprot:gnl/Chilomastix_caulleri/2808.p1 GENE.gnl/Chilomastix_caulleri/2808~~gnl/Chilomastix_caulleri/2808.p1  ORF type:complete len:149 (+),score=45.92 gnl/Chilomastix_caulleri/2808:64-510(+)